MSSRAVIGRDCKICDPMFVENDVILGNRVIVKCGVQLWDGVRLEDVDFGAFNTSTSAIRCCWFLPCMRMTIPMTSATKVSF